MIGLIDKFGIKGEINLTFHEVKGYTPQSLSKNKVNLTRLTSLTNNDDRVDFNINSEEDFPKLG